MTGIPPGERITTLDGLRGGAVMGILLMNAAAFAMPFAAYDNPANYGAPGRADILAWALAFVAVDGKMRAIFSALFGASLLLIADRADATGGSAARLHFARMAILLLFGLAHACLIWEGDILVLYALVGAAAFPLRRLALPQLLVLAGVLMLFQLALLAVNYQGLAALADAAAQPHATAATRAAWRGVLDTIGRPTPGSLATDLALHRGPWAPLAARRLADEPAGVTSELLFNGPETLALMLLGMAGLRSGFLAGGWPRQSYLRAATIAYLASLPLLAGAALLLIARDFPPLLTSALADFALPLRWLAAFGHVALLAAWFGRGRSALRLRIAAAGRVALTNYLGTSLLMAALFDGWGFGLFGRIERWALLPITLAVWTVMLAWSKPWLDHFHHGPIEWLWRLLARGRVPPFRRKAIAS